MSVLPPPASAAREHGVLMLTWSDWFTEPRSNRYHYAARFAASQPVLFLQPTLAAGERARIEASGVRGLDVMLLPDVVTPGVARQVLQAARERGMRQPLLWIYSSTHYDAVLAAFPHSLRVYHASEDYLTPVPGWTAQSERLARSVRRLLEQVDAVVAVSERVLATFRDLPFGGALQLAPNGCDAGHLAALTRDSVPLERVAVFQGGINHRLDFDLLREVAGRLPHWEFRFFGRADESLPGWRALRSLPNVRYGGELGVDELAARMGEAAVGLIPFLQEQYLWNSLPLKAYEYVACGLPVVTVPIDALQQRPDLFRTAADAASFADAIDAAAPSRTDPALLQVRRAAADAQSYDRRFAEVAEAVDGWRSQALARAKRLDLLLLARGRGGARGMLDALAAHSRHRVHRTLLLPPGAAALRGYDAVVLAEGESDAAALRALARYEGLRVLAVGTTNASADASAHWDLVLAPERRETEAETVRRADALLAAAVARPRALPVQRPVAGAVAGTVAAWSRAGVHAARESADAAGALGWNAIRSLARRLPAGVRGRLRRLLGR